MSIAKSKLFKCHSYRAPPYERGTHCIGTNDNGYVIAGSEEEAKNLIYDKFNIDRESMIVCACHIKRFKNNIAKIKEEMINYYKKVNILSNVLSEWLADNKCTEEQNDS